MPGSMFPFGKDSQCGKEKREPDSQNIMKRASIFQYLRWKEKTKDLSYGINLLHVFSH